MTVERVVGRALPGACPGVVDFVVSVRKVEIAVPAVDEEREVVVASATDESALAIAEGVTEDTGVLAPVVVLTGDVGVNGSEPRSRTT